MAAARLNALLRTISGTAPTRIITAPATTTRTSSSSSSSSSALLSSSSQIQRRMASTTTEPRKYEWLVVIPDKPGSMATRLEVRPQHFAGLEKAKASGAFKMGGAVLEEMPPDDEVSSMKFAGSTVMVVAESRQAVIDLLKDDVYVKSGVWDLEKAMIWPAKIAFRYP